MFEIIKAIIYGIIQGITEWLPISSTGHLILLEPYIPFKIFETINENKEFTNMFFVVIQLGSILAVMLLSFKELFPFTKEKSKQDQINTLKLWLLIIIASVPAAVIGLLFDDYIDQFLYNTPTIAITLILYGIIFIIVENKKIKVRVKNSDQLSIIDAIKVGCFQMLALIPGTSRSGATIIGSRYIGINRLTAAKFSFFLAIPVMFGASLLKIIKLKISFNVLGATVLLTGSIIAFLVSLIVIKKFLNYIKKHSFSFFGYYRIILGLIILIYLMVK